MDCLLCDFKFSRIDWVKRHYVDFDGVNENNPYFLDLFQPDTLEKKCLKCRVKFDTCRMKKNHMFLYHYNQQQMGGARQTANDVSLNILKRGQITYYSVNFDQHKDCYDFHSTDKVDIFLDVVYRAFDSQNMTYKFPGYFEIINQ